MYKFLFELLTDPLGLPVPWIWEYIILLVLNEIAFRIAWDASPGGAFGSEIHWAVRLPVFVVIWAITYAVISVTKWIFENWILVVSILGVIILCAGIVAIILLRINKHKNKEKLICDK